jgi:hypothetical protein
MMESTEDEVRFFTGIIGVRVNENSERLSLIKFGVSESGGLWKDFEIIEQGSSPMTPLKFNNSLPVCRLEKLCACKREDCKAANALESSARSWAVKK